MSNAYAKRGKLINMLEDFDFKIVHQASAKHGNFDALNHNLVNPPTEGTDFVDEICG